MARAAVIGAMLAPMLTNTKPATMCAARRSHELLVMFDRIRQFFY